MCVKKKRWLEKDTMASRMGLHVFQLYFFRTTNAKKYKSFEDFVDSRYYSDFVKFGRYIADVDPLDPDEFIEHIFSSGVALKDWTNILVYEDYLEKKMKREPVYRAIERSLLTMEEWANKNNDVYINFFRKGDNNEISYYVRSGKISPWVLYLAESSRIFLNNINEDHWKMICKIIDPIKWQVIFKTKQDDVEMVTITLKEAGL
jgi:hypothetical protein